MAMAPSVNVRKKTGFLGLKGPGGTSSNTNKDFPVASGKKLTLASATAVTPPAKAETKFNPGTKKSGFNVFGDGMSTVKKARDAVFGARVKNSVDYRSPPKSVKQGATGDFADKMQGQNSGPAKAKTGSDMPAPASSKNPGAGTANMTGTSTQRGNVRTLQTKFQRDDLAMNSRKKK
jgi:hypothetical protein